MSGIILVLVGILVICPFIVTISVVLVMRRKGKSLPVTIGLACDLTTPFLFIAVYIVAQLIVGEKVGIYITLITLFIVIINAILERLRAKEFGIFRVFRKTWRMYFMILTIAYILLLILGSVLKVVEYVT